MSNVKKHLLLVFIMVFLQSCAWTYRLNPFVGSEYMVKDIGSVIFYDEPSFKSPSFSLQKPEMFTVTGFVCPEGRFSCNIEMLKDPYSGFYKIRFDSGKEGYINSKHFDMVKKSRTRPASPASPTPPSADYYSFVTQADMLMVTEAITASLNELSFAILATEDGYMLAKRDDDSKKVKVAINIKKTNSSIKVTVGAYIEQLSYPRGDESIVFIDKVKSDGTVESEIIEKINLKLKP